MVRNPEVKNKLPTVGSKALDRLKDQLLAAQAAGIKPYLVTNQHFTRQELKAVLKYLKGSGMNTGASGLGVINGLVAFASWIGRTYGVVCLEI